MSVDKFGHYYNSMLNNNNILRKNVEKTANIIVDNDKNLNIQNKRIKNIATPLEEKDAVTKGFLFTQIEQIQKDLLLIINKNSKELDMVREYLKRMENLLNDVLKDKIDILPLSSISILQKEELDKLIYNTEDGRKENTSKRIA